MTCQRCPGRMFLEDDELVCLNCGAIERPGFTPLPLVSTMSGAIADRPSNRSYLDKLSSTKGGYYGKQGSLPPDKRIAYR